MCALYEIELFDNYIRSPHLKGMARGYCSDTILIFEIGFVLIVDNFQLNLVMSTDMYR